MATNDWMLPVLATVFIFICGFSSQATASAKNVHYLIANANQQKLTSDAYLTLSFSKASASARFKRQTSSGTSSNVDDGAVNADTASSTVNGNDTLPDDSNTGNSNSGVTVDAPGAAVQTTTTTATTTQEPELSTAAPESNPLEDADIIHDEHTYYNSSIYKEKVDDYWVELETTPKHEVLSTGHRVAVVIPLKFKFYFYGHPVDNVTVATGGFIYMSPFLHKWLTATQYIAPLMANFDPSMHDGSSIYYKSYDDKFIVEWRDVVLKDQNTTILNQDSSIIFVYKQVPIAVSSISTDQHPVKIGLSDAYYNDTYIPEFNIKKRTIYEYHKVVVPTDTIVSGTVVHLNTLPTCNRLEDCNSCTQHTGVAFDCQWCNTIGRCSDGLDWYRQHWDYYGCKEINVENSYECVEVSTTPVTFVNATTINVQSSSTTSTTTTTTTKSTTTATSTTSTSTTTPTTTTTTTSTTTTSTPATPAGINYGRSVDGSCGHTTDSSVCSSLPPPTNPIIDPHSSPINPDKCADGSCKDKDDFPVAVVVIVCLALVGIIGAMGTWLYYAYTHPTSRSGMWLMEHRPSQIKAKIKFWKTSTDSSAKYKADSEA